MVKSGRGTDVSSLTRNPVVLAPCGALFAETGLRRHERYCTRVRTTDVARPCRRGQSSKLPHRTAHGVVNTVYQYVCDMIIRNAQLTKHRTHSTIRLKRYIRPFNRLSSVLETVSESFSSQYSVRGDTTPETSTVSTDYNTVKQTKRIYVSHRNL